ncbi:MAG TPA: hypothetical protein VF266_19220 [Thermoanaerobaculia bacterium]
MKIIRTALTVVLLSLCSAAFAQADAKQSFARLKALAGTWEGRMILQPPVPGADGALTTVTLRVTSMGNTLMHEMTSVGRPDDPITMFYVDGDRLELTHFCDANNRPRMVAKSSNDDRKIEFEFLDVKGSMKYGHMHGTVFTLVDENHHIEEWTFMRGDKPYHARIELRRKE